MTATLPLTLSEKDFQSTVIEYAYLRRWMVAHYRPARTNRGWATPVEGHVGCPDLILARDGRVVLVELKAQQGRLSPGQRLWLDAAGGNGFVWKPSDWPEVLETLR